MARQSRSRVISRPERRSGSVAYREESKSQGEVVGSHYEAHSEVLNDDKHLPRVKFEVSTTRQVIPDTNDYCKITIGVDIPAKLEDLKATFDEWSEFAISELLKKEEDILGPVPPGEDDYNG